MDHAEMRGNALQHGMPDRSTYQFLITVNATIVVGLAGSSALIDRTTTSGWY